MKRLLLATATMLVAALTSAAAEEIKINDAIKFSGPAIACRNSQTIDAFEQWFLSVSTRDGNNDLTVPRFAPERWAAMHACEIWRDSISSLLVVNTDSRAPLIASSIKLCVHSLFIFGGPGPKLGSNECTWIFLSKQNVWNSEKESRQ